MTTLKDLKAKMDEDTLDLSVQGLDTVPCKELAVLKRATKLDLSCNKLEGLPSEFVTLTHLVELDLSQNSIFALPEDIGRLTSLQKLDLYKNQLEMVKHMGEVASSLERERQKRLAQEREASARAAAAEAKQAQEKSAMKKAEKENRKKNKSPKAPTPSTQDNGSSHRNGKEQNGKRQKEPMKKRGVCGSLFAFIFGLIRLVVWSAVCVGFVVLTAAGLLMLNCSYKPQPFIADSEGVCRDVETWVATGKIPANANNFALAAQGVRKELSKGVTWVTSQDYGQLANDAYAATGRAATRTQTWFVKESGPFLKRTQKNFIYYASHAGDYATIAARWVVIRTQEAGAVAQYYGKVAWKEGQVYYAKAVKSIASYAS